MDDEQVTSRLSRISTAWTLIRDAHHSADAGVRARNELMERYHGAVYRYLLGALRDPDEADELFQQFALRFARGEFLQRADPERGRFRNYVRTVLINLVNDHKRRLTPRHRMQSIEAHELAAPAPAEQELFLTSWRDELLAKTWNALAERGPPDGRPYFRLLKLRTNEPRLSSADLARRLNEQLAPAAPYSASGIRKLLQRARQQFADLLLDEIAHSLGDPTRSELEQELAELQLMHYCRGAVDRRYS